MSAIALVIAPLLALAILGLKLNALGTMPGSVCEVCAAMFHRGGERPLDVAAVKSYRPDRPRIGGLNCDFRPKNGS